MTSNGWSNPVLKVRALTEVSERRKRPSTYTDPLTKSPDMKEFLQTFYKNVYRPEKKEWYHAERAKYPTLQQNYDDLCGKTVSYEDFWMRYERRCNLERVMKELADKDAAQVESTKKAVSGLIHKAWNVVPSQPSSSTTTTAMMRSGPDPAEESLHGGAFAAAPASASSSSSITVEGTATSAIESATSGEKKASAKTSATTAKAVVEVTKTQIVNDQNNNNNTQDASPQTSMRESISKALGTSSWSIPSSMVASPPSPSSQEKKLTEQQPKKETEPAKKEPTQSSVTTPLSTAATASEKTGRHGVPKTETQDSILNELKKKFPGRNKNDKSAATTPTATTHLTTSSNTGTTATHTTVTTAAKLDTTNTYDNQMADRAALLLLLVFLIVTNLQL